MNDVSKTVAVVFADISGSTQLYETQGDVVAREMTSQAITVMASCVTKVGGRVVKTIGDEIMASFPSAMAAYNASIAMQDTIEAPFSIRIGCHFGPVLEENDDIFGDTVNVAARVTNIATSGEIILTESVLTHLSPSAREHVRFLDEAELKGKSLPVRIYQVVMAGGDETFIGVDNIRQRQTIERVLCVTYRGRDYIPPSSGEALTLGRGGDCTISVQEVHASRSHAKIHHVYGKFLVTDHSMNGTYVISDNGEPLFVKRETMQIGNRGEIYLGLQPTPGYTGVIVFAMANQTVS